MLVRNKSVTYGNIRYFPEQLGLTRNSIEIVRRRSKLAFNHWNWSLPDIVIS